MFLSMVNVRKFTISDDHFSGFSQMIDLDEFDSLNEICSTVYGSIFKLLTRYNFIILLEKLKEKNFHIHDYTFESLLMSNSNKEFFICSHC